MLQNILKNKIDEVEIKNTDNQFLFWVFERENEHNFNKILFQKQYYHQFYALIKISIYSGAIFLSDIT